MTSRQRAGLLRRVGALLAVAVSLAVIGFTDIASGSKSATVRIALAAPAAPGSAAIRAAIDGGSFADEGIAPVLVRGTGSSAVALVAAGEADLALVTPRAFLVARSSGADVRAVAAAGPIGAPVSLYVAGAAEIATDPGVLRRTLAAVTAATGATGGAARSARDGTTARSWRAPFSRDFGPRPAAATLYADGLLP